MEAANCAIRKCPYAKAFYDRKRKETKLHVTAIKALASKMARACYYIMRDDVDYDVKKIFKNIKLKTDNRCGSKPEKGMDKKPSA